ncbi:ABC transporter ATP-binding protein [Kribbella sp. CA-293567]|uniref:ABC transporter ATP-binding protein n=1 Tax=Kribbella sp. CA-293567 TaxID=3002436 RepID=UPI0022DD5688|nr:ABC transporter ATP-binding protein [Kribbella sp. CA-293567]WBQ07620.1 ABC transporter ATP-binding protein [Kribbella sp. CA-293567]
MRQTVRAFWLVVSTAIRVSPVQTLLCLCETAAVGCRLLQPLFLAWFVGGVVAGDRGRIVTATAAFMAVSTVRLLLNLVGVNARIGQLERVGYAFGNRIAMTAASIPTTDHLESAAYLDQMQTIRDQEWSLGLATNMLLNSFNNLVLVGGTIALASTADWRLVLVALAGLPTVAAARWFVRWQGVAEDAAAQHGRLAGQLLDLLVRPVSGAEVRIFGLTEDLRRRVRDTSARWRRPYVLATRKKSGVQIVGSLLFFGVAVTVLGWMLTDIIAGRQRIEAMVLALLLIGRLQSIGDVMQRTIDNLSQVARTAGRILWLLDYERVVLRQHGGTQTPPRRLRKGIQLTEVSYRYESGGQPVLKDLSLELPAGSIVAVVGENGAGKSTLVKLLAGLSRPTAGQIQLDGEDLAGFDIVAWRKRLSGAFQDYARFELTAGQNVGLGDLEQLTNRERIDRALDRGAAAEVLASLPNGLETQLGSSWPQGVDISGGQWQRLALARGMMRESPLLLMLDEPTAALDAHTEHALFERYTRAARAGRHLGLITLLVTHRFSTVAAADLIVVLDGGRVIEQGSHEILLAAQGRYAELYRLQARGYR